MALTKESISIFFPAYNEEKAIEKSVGAALEVAERLFIDYEVIVVDDGSRDRTGAIADRLAAADPKVRVVHHTVNRGYGAALRSGFAAARKELVFFTDGDGQFDLSELEKLLPLIVEADLAIGYRLKRVDPPHRLLYARLYKLLISLLFGLWVKDIDCAFKLIRKDALRSLDLKSDGALISAELLIKAKKKGLRIKEVGVHHYSRQGGQPTGGKFSVAFKALLEIFKFWWELR